MSQRQVSLGTQCDVGAPRLLSRLAGVTAVVVMLMGTLAACGDDRPERAITIDPQDSKTSSTTAPEADGERVKAPLNAAGARLTKAQIDAALLTVNDLPSGWAKSPDEDDDDDGEDTIDPARCQELMDALDDDSTDAAAEGETSFNKGGPFGTIMSETISSYEREVDPARVQEIADALSECPDFTSTDAEGEVSKVTVSPMSFANLGDQTLAFTMTLESSMFTVSVNVAYVVIGHNVVTLVNGGIGGADGAQLEKIAKRGIAKLEASTA